jgi:hypothetical protein
VQGKQAKIVSPTQERAILEYLETTRYPHRDRVMFLLSMKAGLRAKEIASLTWAMVTDVAGQIAEAIHLQNQASKGKAGGRTIPMHPRPAGRAHRLADRARSRRCSSQSAAAGCCRPRCACGSIGCIRRWASLMASAI